MTIKMGDYEVVVKKGEQELETMPDDLPVFDFEGNVTTLSEARDGFMRNKDYTQKTQSVAEMKKFMVEELGFQDQTQAIGTMRRIFDTLNELEQAGVLDTQTGEVKLPKSKQAPVQQNLGDDDETGFTLGMENLPPEIRELKNAHAALQKDMGSLMGYISRREVREQFDDVTEEEVEMVHKLAAMEPSKSPLEHMAAYQQKKEEWGQKAVDTYVEDLKKPKQEGHERPGAGEPGIEIFGETPVFSFQPGEHAEGTNVISPSEAANKFMEGVMKELKGE